jgi:hypothetical protein
MQQKNRAFYRLADRLEMGPIEAGHLERWIEERIRAAGMEVEAGVAELILRAAGPRTQDVVMLARKSFDRSRADGRVEIETVRSAFLEQVAEEEDLARLLWNGLTARQQNLLRALAAGEPRLTSQQTLRRYGLGSSGNVSPTLRGWVETGLLTETDAAPGYAFDSPFFRGWVVLRALPDLQIHRDPLEPAGGVTG